MKSLPAPASFRLFLCLMIVGALSACTTSYEKFYQKLAPMHYPPTKAVQICIYDTSDLPMIADTFFGRSVVIGKSSFEGPPGIDVESATSFAKSIGADAILCVAKDAGTISSLMPLSTPVRTTSYHSGYLSDGTSFRGTTDSTAMTRTLVPVNFPRVDYLALYLRKVKGGAYAWEQTEAEYKRVGPSALDGIWTDSKYRIKVYKTTENRIVGTIVSASSEKQGKPGDFKFMFAEKSGVGAYRDGRRAPQLAVFKLNKFGHLEFSSLSVGLSISFARVENLPPLSR